nr:hypothetical protein [uncultured Ruegeria sp.]
MAVFELEGQRTLFRRLPTAIKPEDTARGLALTNIGKGRLPKRKIIQIEAETLVSQSILPRKPARCHIPGEIRPELWIGHPIARLKIGFYRGWARQAAALRPDRTGKPTSLSGQRKCQNTFSKYDLVFQR